MSNQAGRSKRQRVASIALTLLAVAAWWLTLAPRAVGGPTSVVVVDGTSMQPLFHTGDVVITHREPSYHLGEIVAVKVDGGEVIHRLVAGNATAGWRTQGINRKTMDSWVIPNKNVIGRRWLFLPAAGRWTSWARTPTGAGWVFGGLCFLSILVPSKRRRSRHHQTLEQAMRDAKHAEKRTGNDAAPWVPRVPAPIEPTLLGGFGLTSTALLIAAISWTLPKSRLSFVPYRPGSPMLPIVWSVLAVLALTSALLAARVFRGWGGKPEDKAYACLRDRLVPVRSIRMDGSIVSVSSPQELRKIAVINVAPVLHQVTPRGHRFAVVDQDVVYEFSLESTAARSLRVSQAMPSVDELERWFSNEATAAEAPAGDTTPTMRLIDLRKKAGSAAGAAVAPTDLDSGVGDGAVDGEACDRAGLPTVALVVLVDGADATAAHEDLTDALAAPAMNPDLHSVLKV